MCMIHVILSVEQKSIDVLIYPFSMLSLKSMSRPGAGIQWEVTRQKQFAFRLRAIQLPDRWGPDFCEHV